MKIRLIQAPQLDDKGKFIKYKKLFFPFLTVPTVAALTPGDVDVHVTDGFVEDIDFDEDLDLVGVSSQTSQATAAYKIGDEFRKRGVKTIIGGVHATLLPDEAKKHFDSVLVGEAEDIWEEILLDLKHNRLKKIYKPKGYSNLSKLIIPRFDLMDFKNYVIPPFARTPLLPVLATKGCPHNCDFCVVHKICGRKIRSKPVEHVIQEIETVKPSRFVFVDDNIFANPDYAKEMFNALKPLKTRWVCQMSTTVLKHPKLIELAAEAGCHENFMGIESINIKNLKDVKKGFNKVEDYKRLFTMLKDVGILAQASMIFGFDNDSLDSLRKTIDTILEWDINYLYIFILTPLPGTELHKRLSKEKRIVDTNWGHYDVTRIMFKTKSISPEDLSLVYWESYERFYSIKEIFKRLWKFKKQYIKFFPRDLFHEEVFFSLSMHNLVKRHIHPFSIGIKIEK